MRDFPTHSRGFGSIKTRILFILGILALGYLVLLALVQFTAAATHGHIEQASTSLFPAALQLQQAKSSFEDLQQRYKDAVLLEDSGALAAAEKDAETETVALANLRVLVADSPALASRTDDLIARFASIRARAHDTYAALLASQTSIPEELQRRAVALAADNKQFAAGLANLDSAVSVQFRDQLGLIDEWSHRSRTAGWCMLLVALAGCAGAWNVLRYRVFIPLEGLAHRMQDIAEGDGDLTGRVEVNGNNELDEVGFWFNVFIERVEQVVIRVSGNAQNLAEAAAALAETARETASEIALQQEQATRIASSMGEISMAVHEISKTTQLAADDARKSEKNAHSGGRTIQATVNTIQELLGASQATASKVEELGNASKAIGKIVQIIAEIAYQTRLLALNAAIESARAGEHGRGFAVVAGEVGRLAERTRNATGDIGRTVREMQEGTAEVVEAMRASMRHVEGGVSSAHSAGEALRSIILGSEAMQLMVTQIASASSEQSAATQSVNANLNEIANIGVRATSSSARAVDACDRLAALAADLNQLVGAFKVTQTTVAVPDLREAEVGIGQSPTAGSTIHQCLVT